MEIYNGNFKNFIELKLFRLYSLSVMLFGIHSQTCGDLFFTFVVNVNVSVCQGFCR